MNNQSEKPIDLLSTVSLSGPNASEFTLQNQCTTAVAPYTACKLGFTWIPKSAGFRKAQIAITDLAIQKGQVVISIAGDATK